MSSQTVNAASRQQPFGKIDCSLTSEAGGAFTVQCATPLEEYPASIVAVLEERARLHPDRILFREEAQTGKIDEISYGAFWQIARCVATRLLDCGGSPARPVALIAENSIRTALVIVAAYIARVPVAPISPAYSKLSRDFAKLHYVLDLLQPSILIFDDGLEHASALDRVAGSIDRVIVMENAPPAYETWHHLIDAPPLAYFSSAIQANDVAKILLTSGSTGMPKGVINTHGMMVSNQQAIRQIWPTVSSGPPRMVDWLPWNHTFGGNQNFNLAIFNGGTLRIDRGKPTPGGIASTIRAIKETRPTIYFNVPRGLDLLVSALASDAELCEALFADLELLVYAGAALPTPIWDALRVFARQIKGYDIPIAGSWGSTETGPLATAVYFPNDHAGNIGLPIPECAIKFVPDSNKLEMRVRAPSVTPGYWRQPELTAAMFDEDGFYKIGDAGCLARPDRLQAGILFDGRIGENFKLLSGTWVNVGMLRVAVVASCPELIADAVIAGHNRDHATALIFPKVDGCRRLAEAGSNADIRAVLSAPQVCETIRAAIASHNRRAGGSSNRIARALILDEPPSIDGHEITDKGYLNQRAVLERRAALVDRLYAATSSGDIIVID